VDDSNICCESFGIAMERPPSPFPPLDAPLFLQDPFSLFVAVDASGAAHGQLYVDDSHTFEYQEKMAFVLRDFTLKHEGGAYTFSSRYAVSFSMFGCLLGLKLSCLALAWLGLALFGLPCVALSALDI